MPWLGKCSASFRTDSVSKYMCGHPVTILVPLLKREMVLILTACQAWWCYHRRCWLVSNLSDEERGRHQDPFPHRAPWVCGRVLKVPWLGKCSASFRTGSVSKYMCGHPVAILVQSTYEYK